VVHCTPKLLSLLGRGGLLFHWGKLLLTLASCIFLVRIYKELISITRQHLSKDASGVVCSHMIVKFADYSMCICSWLENVRVDARNDSIPLLTIA